MPICLLKFLPMNRKSTGIVVHSKNPVYMDLFLKQHSITDMAKEVMIIDDSELHLYDADGEMYALSKFRIKSNQSDEIINLITSYDFMCSAIDDASHCMANAMRFGSAIIRTDIPVIKMINGMLLTLPYGGIATEWTEMDPDDCYDGAEEYVERTMDTDPGDTSALVNEIHSAFSDSEQTGDVVPITLEAYISTFREKVFGIIV